MFKKTTMDYQPQEQQPIYDPPSSPIEPPRPLKKESATIGPSISIAGDLTGEEDLVIQGRIEGKVDLKQYSVTIGKNGRAKADILGRIVTVEGEVEGNLFGQEQIVIRNSGVVHGDLSAPRVSIEDGARFKGRIDMEHRIVEEPRLVIPPEPRNLKSWSQDSDQALRAEFS